MAVLPASNSFEGGTSATAISAANSGGASGTAFDAVAGTGFTYQTAAALHGLLGGRLAFSANVAGGGTLNWTALGSITTHVYGRVYVRLSALPTSVCNIFRINTSAVARSMQMRFTTGGAIQLTNAAATSIGTNTAAVSLNTWYRIEWDVVSSTTAGSIAYTVYLGDSTTAWASPAAVTGQVLGANSDQVLIGEPSATLTAAVNFDYDDVQVNTTGLPGPSVRRSLVTSTRGMAQRHLLVR